MAEEISVAEKLAGLDSSCLDGDNPGTFPKAEGADVHVIHGHLPAAFDTDSAKKVFVAHGTPESCFISSMSESVLGHGASDAFMQSLYRVKASDAVATFWPRHQAIWKSMMDRGRDVDLIPMGIDRSKWKRRECTGKWAGSPSLLTAENCHSIKWPLDLFTAMPWVMQELRDMRLHCFYIPLDQIRWWTMLSCANGSAYRTFMVSACMNSERLLDAFCSVDFYIGLVRYGDHDRICLEAKVAGCPVISHRGNEYADFWIDEGDQRTIAAQLLMILKGQVSKRESKPVPDISETAAALRKIYERIL